MSKRTLLVGLDLGERYSQLAVYDPARVEADLMCQTEDQCITGRKGAYPGFLEPNQRGQNHRSRWQRVIPGKCPGVLFPQDTGTDEEKISVGDH